MPRAKKVEDVKAVLRKMGYLKPRNLRIMSTTGRICQHCGTRLTPDELDKVTMLGFSCDRSGPSASPTVGATVEKTICTDLFQCIEVHAVRSIEQKKADAAREKRVLETVVLP